MSVRPIVVLSLFGPRLDAGRGKRRWRKWRPTVSIAQHNDLPVTRLEVLYPAAFADGATFIKGDIEEVSASTKVGLFPIEMDDPWSFEEVYEALFDFVRSYPFDPAREDYLVHITTGTHVAQICLFLLCESRHLPGRLLQTTPPPKEGASPGAYVITDLDLSRYDRIASRFEKERADDVALLKAGIQTRNEMFNRTIERIERVALASSAPILLTGPTGAGKSELARRIFHIKKHRLQVRGELVEVNCATLKGDNAMSALFGHERGAFTGAIQARTGLLRRANGGLLFLDEIGELGLDEQAMLLRALEEKRFLPLGADRESSSDFQLIAGSNRNLKERVAQGQFRHDLLARINMWTFRLPSLVERREDIEPNLEFELENVGLRMRRNVTISKEARQQFLEFALSSVATWDGNFRDFIASISRMATLAPGGRITESVVAEETQLLLDAWKPSTGHDEVAAFLGDDQADKIDRFDRVQLAEVLRVVKTSRSLSAAGRSLFAVSRTKRRSVNDADRLRKYLARFGLDFDGVRDSALASASPVDLARGTWQQ